MSVVANVAINVDSRNAVSNLRQVERQAQITQRAFDGLSSALASIGVGLALGKVIQDVKELDTNLRRLGTVGVDVAKINPALSRLSDELGGVANKAELAAASYQAASAGFSDTAGNIQILNAATKAAVGGLADTSAVTEVLVKTLNAYGMSGSEAFKVTDSISKAVELGNQEWSDYTSLLGRVASISALAGVSIDELNAFIASATKNGATAEVAFTGLGAVLNTLLQPTKESQEAAAALGIAWNYGGLQAKGFTGLMAELAKAMEKDKETTARLLGSQEAMRGAFAANAKGGADFRMVLEQLSGAAGKTDSDFNTMKGSLENTLKALDTSFKNLSEALGRAFGPTVVLVIQDITKGINGFADVMNAVPQPVLNATGQIIKMIAQAVLLKKAIEGIIALRAGFIGAMGAMGATTAATGTAATTSASAFALYTRNTQAVAAAAAGATPKLTALRGILGSIAAMGVITVAVNIIVNGLQETFAANAELAKLRGRRAAGGAAATFAGATKETVTGAQGQARKTQAAIKKERAGLTTPGARALQFLNVGGALSPFGVQTITGAGQRLQVLGAREREAQAILGLSAAGRPSASSFTGGGGNVAGAAGGGGGAKPKGKSDADKAAELAAKQAEQLMGAKMQLELARKIFSIENRMLEARFAGNKPLELARNTQKELAQIAGEAAIIKADKDMPIAQKLVELEKLKVKSAEAARSLSIEIAQIEFDRNKTFEQTIVDLDNELKLKAATTEQEREQLRIAQEMAKLKGQGFTPEQLAAIQQRKTQLAAPKTDAQKVEERVGQLKKEIADLTNVGNVAIRVADGIGIAFGEAFQGLISGSMSAQEALGNFFKSVGDMFIQMATEIIAKQMTMIILQTILKALGAVGGGGGGGGGGNYSGAFSSTPGTSFADALKMPSLRAGGGPAVGGTPYLVGERGPELFVPGTSGGVMSNNDLRQSMNSGGSPVLNMSFETTRFGDTEYVSRDQLEAAMAETRRQASRDGAQRGMTMTLDRIQNSSATRRRIGV